MRTVAPSRVMDLSEIHNGYTSEVQLRTVSESKSYFDSKIKPQVNVQVDICGQLTDVSFPQDEMKSLSVLNMAIQLQLGGKGADLVFNDNAGKAILTDDELRIAVTTQNVPLRASLCDSNIHTLESKRDELAQMQWRMVRQQFTTLSDSVQGVSVDVQALNEDLAHHKALTMALPDSICNEVNAQLKKEMVGLHKYVTTLVNRIDFLEQGLHQEQTAREMVLEKHKQDFDSMKNMIHSDKEQLMKSLSLVRSSMDDVAQDFQKAEEGRHQLAIKCKSDFTIVQDRYEELKRELNQESQHRGVLYRQMVVDHAATKKDMEEKISVVENEIRATRGEVTNRLQQFDTVCHQQYQQFVQLLEEKDITSVELSKRIHCYRNDFQDLREEFIKNSPQFSSHVDKIEELAKQIVQVEKKGETLLQEDCAKREEQYRNLDHRMALVAKQMQSLSKVLSHWVCDPSISSAIDLVNEQMDALPDANHSTASGGGNKQGQEELPAPSSLSDAQLKQQVYQYLRGASKLRVVPTPGFAPQMSSPRIVPGSRTVVPFATPQITPRGTPMSPGGFSGSQCQMTPCGTPSSAYRTTLTASSSTSSLTPLKVCAPPVYFPRSLSPLSIKNATLPASLSHRNNSRSMSPSPLTPPCYRVDTTRPI